MDTKGKLIWITGLSGAGKTSIGSAVSKELKKNRPNVVFLDGDVLRQIYDDVDYSTEGRHRNAFRSSRMCKMLTDQNIDVVCSIIAMYDDCREWNRTHIENYYEIYLDVSLETLIKRDQKQLYSRALRNEIENVLGINSNYEAPKSPTLTVHNEGIETPETIAQNIIKTLNL